MVLSRIFCVLHCCWIRAACSFALPCKSCFCRFCFAHCPGLWQDLLSLGTYNWQRYRCQVTRGVLLFKPSVKHATNAVYIRELNRFRASPRRLHRSSFGGGGYGGGPGQGFSSHGSLKPRHVSDSDSDSDDGPRGKSDPFDSDSSSGSGGAGSARGKSSENPFGKGGESRGQKTKDLSVKATRVDDDDDDTDDDDDHDAHIDYDDDPMDWEETSDDEDDGRVSDHSLSSSDDEQNLDDANTTAGGGGAQNLSVALSAAGNKKRCSRFGLECRGGAASHRFAVSLANVELSKIVKEDPPELDEVRALPTYFLCAYAFRYLTYCFCFPVMCSHLRTVLLFVHGSLRFVL